MTDQPALQLYAYWRSMAAYRVRVALNLKGIRAQEIPVNLEAGEQLAPEFLAVNPEGAVPALIEPGQPPLTQSTAILEYLDERFPEPPLLLKDLRARARVRSLAALITSDTHPMIVPRVIWGTGTPGPGFMRITWPGMMSRHDTGVSCPSVEFVKRSCIPRHTPSTD
jgi:glutathione S-transferase